MPTADPQLDFFPSLDFPDRAKITIGEIAEKVGCSIQHLLNEIDRGDFVVLDISSRAVSRRAIIVPIESYRNWVISKLTGPVDLKMRFLRDLPASTRRELITELQASLKTNP